MTGKVVVFIIWHLLAWPYAWVRNKSQNNKTNLTLYLLTSFNPTLFNPCGLISLRPSDAYMHQHRLNIIGSENGLSPGQHQAIIWINAGILITEPSETNFCETKFNHFHSTKCIWRCNLWNGSHLSQPQYVIHIHCAMYFRHWQPWSKPDAHIECWHICKL